MSYKIGITGGIASGKSLVCSFLRELGIPVVSADDIVKELQKDEYYLSEIRKLFGDEVFIGRELNRKKLAEIIFSNEAKRELLNKLLHPPVLEEIKKRIEKLKDYRIIAIEVPLLFEVGIEDWFDEIWVVYIPIDLQIKRIMERDKLTKEEALLRIRSQIPLEEKVKKAHFVIFNDGDEKNTKEQVKKRISYIDQNII
ncbi:MAG: dephospho-CoA kinase [Dictyoglomus sp.]